MPTRVFLPSSKRLLPQIVDRLLPESGSGPLRMEDRWIIAPTKQAGRRLREALTQEWRLRGGTALLGLEVHPPSILFQQNLSEQMAHPFDWMTAWQQILLHRDPGSLPALMPQQTAPLNASAALSFGQRLQRLRDELFDAGLDLSSVATSPLLSSEQERWKDLASLETEYRKQLKLWGMEDPVDAKRVALNQFTPPAGTNTMILAGVPDPTPIVLKRLIDLDTSVSIEVWVHGEESDASYFSSWGVPLEAWQDRSVGHDPEPEGWIECLASPAAVLERMKEIAASAPEHSDLGVGLLDSSLSKPMSSALQSEDRNLYDPSPVPLGESPWVRLLNAFHQHRTKDDPESLRALWRQPLLLKACCPEHPVGLLRKWETYAAECFPDSTRAVDATVKDPELKKAWEKIKEWVACETAAEGLACFRELTQGETLDPGVSEDRFRLREVQKVAEVLQEAVRREEAGRGPDFGILLQALERESVDPLRVEGTFTAEGWLELSYHPADQLMLIGLQEGVVPPPPPIDPILPLQVRTDLGLKSDREWLARDTYLFHTMIASRQPGDVRVWVMKRSRDGSPLMPSRLLFACKDETFLKRTGLLFDDPPPPPAVPPPSSELFFHPERRDHRKLTRLSVSAVNAYLACPTRFYFQVVLGMQKRDDLSAEPDAATFGTLVHRVLEQVVKQGPCSLKEWDQRCEEACTQILVRALGPTDRMSLRVFKHSALKRLKAAGKLQLTCWEDGWEPIEFESALTRSCNGIEITGKLDRIDRHPEKGLRILDYKTSDSPVNPEKAHLGTPREGRELLQLELKGKTRQWKNLQLPLYRWLARDLYPDEPLEVVYMNLPSAVSDTQLAFWDQEPDLAGDAERCLKNTIDLIQQGVWHPTTSSGSPWDPYAPLLLDGSEWLSPSSSGG